MIIRIAGWQDTGKTSLGVGIIKNKLLAVGAHYENGYRPTDVIANLALTWPGAHCLTNHQMKLYISRIVTKGLKHKIILIDEADRLFPARFWHDREQTEALVGLWQDVKLFNVIIYTCHIGTSIDIILRDTAQIEIEPGYDEFQNCIYYRVFNQLHGQVYDDVLENVSEDIFPDYDRWEVIGHDTAVDGGSTGPDNRAERPDFGGLSSRERIQARQEGGGDASLPPSAT